MRSTLALLLVCVAVALSDDTKATTQQFIKNQGFKCTDHVVQFENWRTSVQRIERVGGQPVILMHGILDTSATWVLNTRNTSLGFILADSRYDVWLLNARGNSYSGAGPDWDWTFEDQANDITAAIEYVTKATKTTPILIAHSQGATSSIIALSKPNKPKLKLFVALAPISYLKYQKSPILSLMAKLPLGVVNIPFGPTKFGLQGVFGSMCNSTPALCDYQFDALFGCCFFQSENFRSRMGVYKAHWPDVTSYKNMIHWTHNVRSKDFANFQGTRYNLTTFDTPTAVWKGNGDYLANEYDVSRLVRELGKAVVSELTVFSYSHMDFVWHEYAVDEVYQYVLKQIKAYQ